MRHNLPIMIVSYSYQGLADPGERGRSSLPPNRVCLGRVALISDQYICLRAACISFKKHDRGSHHCIHAHFYDQKGYVSMPLKSFHMKLATSMYRHGVHLDNYGYLTNRFHPSEYVLDRWLWGLNIVIIKIQPQPAINST